MRQNVETHGRASLPETNETMNMHGVDIQTILPQRPPMVMVDRLVCADEKSAETALDIRLDNIFVENGALQPYALMEVMAQTCAAQLGCADRFIKGHDGVKIGYIGSVKKMQIEAVPRVGETLTTRVRITEDFGDMRMAAAECYVEGRPIATAELVITLTDNKIEL